ncbi:MAG: hypothetical protein IJL07_03505 [Lachnospiraceae bacterium]|nr:hypothetical protein [Lachnospiraceae bacterium]
MYKTFIVFMMVIMSFVMDLNPYESISVPEFSDEYLVGFDYGGSSWGEFYDCLDAKVIICTNHDVLILMPTAESIRYKNMYEYEEIGKITLTDMQYSNIETVLDREELYTLKIRSEKDVCDGYSMYLYLYNKDNTVAKECGAYMPTTERFIEIYDAVIDNIPGKEISDIREKNVKRLRRYEILGGKTVDDEEYEANRSMIANELDLDPNLRKVEIIISRYYEFEEGLIKSVLHGTENVDEYLYIQSESGNEYRFYLDGVGVDCIYDITKDEWPVRSYR